MITLHHMSITYPEVWELLSLGKRVEKDLTFINRLKKFLGFNFQVEYYDSYKVSNKYFHLNRISEVGLAIAESILKGEWKYNNKEGQYYKGGYTISKTYNTSYVSRKLKLCEDLSKGLTIDERHFILDLAEYYNDLQIKIDSDKIRENIIKEFT